MCLGRRVSGSWGCARIVGLGRSELLTWGGDQAADEAERGECRCSTPRQEALQAAASVKEGAACLEGARPSEPWIHLPSGVQPPDPVIGLLGPSWWNPGPLQEGRRGLRQVPAVSSLSTAPCGGRPPPNWGSPGPQCLQEPGRGTEPEPQPHPSCSLRGPSSGLPGRPEHEPQLRAPQKDSASPALECLPEPVPQPGLWPVGQGTGQRQCWDPQGQQESPGTAFAGARDGICRGVSILGGLQGGPSQDLANPKAACEGLWRRALVAWSPSGLDSVPSAGTQPSRAGSQTGSR